MSTLDVLCCIMAEMYDVSTKEISAEDSVTSLHRRFRPGTEADSLDAIELVMALEEKTTVTVTEDTVESLTDADCTLQELAERIDRYRMDAK
jgi:acyl carrier protein